MSNDATPLRFADLGLPEPVLRALVEVGYETPSPIQAAALPPLLEGRDVLGQAQTGTGKTAAFALPILARLDPAQREPQALVLAPTRELALQIESDAVALTRTSGLRTVALVGGVDYDQQRRQLDRGFVDIIVATPGRLIDFLEQQEIWLDRLEFLVIDEADRLLDMGFIPSVKRIIRHAPPKADRQTLMFSATFSFDVLNLARQWLHEPVTVEIEPEQTTSQQVDQRFYLVSQHNKTRLLKSVLSRPDVKKAMVFANRRDQVRRVFDRLKAEGLTVGMLSGEMTQDKRIRTLDQFKQDRINVLIATDVAGRGIHVDGISHVINYTLPDQTDDYVHRIGRTGRAGETGTSISFVGEDDVFMLETLQKALRQKLPLERIDGFD